jgi:imidazoleglycerol-phosphate dehydratase
VTEYAGMRVETTPGTGTALGTAAVSRTTREAEVRLVLGRGDRTEPHLDTGIAFFNHMLEQVAWHAALNLDVSFRQKTFALAHVVCEDIGMAFGMAFAALIRDAMADGVEGVATAWMPMDEALAFSAVSVEGRANHQVRRLSAGAQIERVEDMQAVDLVAFLEGFAQGARCTVQLEIAHGVDPHHSWEAAFRAFGVALRGCFRPLPFRAGLTVGVKGTLD